MLKSCVTLYSASIRTVEYWDIVSDKYDTDETQAMSMGAKNLCYIPPSI